MKNVLVIYFLLAIILNQSHLVCPIWLGWSNDGFRKLMLARPEQFVLLPAAAVIAAVIIGATSSSTRDPQFRILATIYAWWNAWHFGSQHYGIASLLGWRSWPRWGRQTVIIAPTMAVMLVPIGGIVMIVVNEVMGLFHWLSDITLTGRVVRRWWWWCGILVIGLVGLEFKTLSIDPRFCDPLPVCVVQWSLPLLVSIRYGLGFWHFLMSRWVWAERGRAAIGRLA